MSTTCAGFKVIKGSLSPSAALNGSLSADSAEVLPDDMETLPSFPRGILGADRRDSFSRLSTSIWITAPLDVQARLNSLTSNSPSRANRPSSSS